VGRYLPNGTPDTSFGNGGSEITDFLGGEEFPRGLVVQSDGKILVAGTATGNNSRVVALSRYNVDGSPDSSFGQGGKVSVPAGPFDEVGGVALSADGKILVASMHTVLVVNGLDYSFSVTRFLPDGSLDRTFGSSGTVLRFSSTNGSGATGIAVAPGGMVWTGGFTSDLNGIALFVLTGDPG
jgi:uncharacterized delta-60 repeat protein